MTTTTWQIVAAKVNAFSLAALALSGCSARDLVREPRKEVISHKGTMLQPASFHFGGASQSAVMLSALRL